MEINLPINKECLSLLADGADLILSFEQIIINRQGTILFAPMQGTIQKKSQGRPDIATLYDYLSHRLIAEERDEFLFLLNTSTTSFSKNFFRGGPFVRCTVIASPIEFAGDANCWLLDFLDVNPIFQVIHKVTAIAEETKKKQQESQQKFETATNSLIDTNITLRKEIRERQLALEKLQISEARFRDLTETTSDFIWEIDSTGNYIYASPKCRKLLGIEPEALLGTPLFLLRKVESASNFIKKVEFVGEVQRGFSKMEYKHRKADDSVVVVESSGEPVFLENKKFVGFRGIDRDVTERYHYELQLKQAKDEAEIANQAKSDFLANMSHELRTPLHAILSYASFGEKRIESAERKDLLRFFKQITTSGQRLLPLIDGLLDLAKLESGKIDLAIKYQALLPEIEAVITELTPLAETRDLIFSIDKAGTSQAFAYFDKPSISQVIRNLLGNAVKFSHRGSMIKITFSQEIVAAHTLLRTSIINSGIVIPANELDLIFEKFEQGSRMKTGAGGTGLGLTICKHIIQNHHGTIWAESGKNEETIFHFTLPAGALPPTE